MFVCFWVLCLFFFFWRRRGKGTVILVAIQSLMEQGQT